MTDRINSFIVVLDHNYRDDDIEYLLNAIRMIKGVQDVVPNVVASNVDEIVGEMRAKNLIRQSLVELIEKI